MVASRGYGAGHARGFSLIELMVTVGVVAILAAIATPNLRAVIANNRLRAQTEELIASLQMARSEAVRRNARIDVCRTTNGTTCAGAVGAWNNWLVLDTQPRAGGETSGVIASATTNPAVAISGSASRVSFSPTGMVAAASTLTVCMPTAIIDENQRVLDLLVGGSVNMRKVNGGGACP